MLAHDVLDAIDLKVDFLGGESSIEEHGETLVDVNKYELCAEHTLPQTEWWNFVHCMYGLQACLSYTEPEMSCGEAESGADDDLELAGTDFVEDCECTVDGAAEYCAVQHTSTDFADLRACKEGDDVKKWYDDSDQIAQAVNDGDPLWIKVNGLTYSYSSNETAPGLASWATAVFAVTCEAIADAKLTMPASCSQVSYKPPAH